MSQKRDFESSLELLLDTMCNSFGGVMFIAISLIIVLSMTSKVKEAVTDNFQNLEEMQTKVEELKKEFTQIQLDTKQIQHALEIFKNDPRLKYLKDIVLLEDKLKKIEMEDKMLSVELEVQNKKNSELVNKKTLIQTELTKKQLKYQKITAENIKQEQELKSLNEELKRTASEHITFKTMSPTQKAPYYLIVFNSKIWRVGPDKKGDPPHSDVNYAKAQQDGQEYIICTIRDLNSGVPLIENGRISPEAYALLQNIPQDRFPSLSIHSDSVEDFCKFREELKKNNTTHSVDTFFESLGNKFIYFYTNTKDHYNAY